MLSISYSVNFLNSLLSRMKLDKSCRISCPLACLIASKYSGFTLIEYEFCICDLNLRITSEFTYISVGVNACTPMDLNDKVALINFPINYFIWLISSFEHTNLKYM